MCSINGRERLHAKGFVNVPVKLELKKWNKELYDPKMPLEMDLTNHHQLMEHGLNIHARHAHIQQGCSI